MPLVQKNNANEAILQHKHPTNVMNTKVNACVCPSVTYLRYKSWPDLHKILYEDRWANEIRDGLLFYADVPTKCIRNLKIYSLGKKTCFFTNVRHIIMSMTT